MAKNFDTEIRNFGGTTDDYLKVFIKDRNRINDVMLFLEGLNCVKRANITSSSSNNSPPENLTVYPSRVYDIKEVDKEVKLALESYFLGNPIDPSFIDEGISSVSDKAYEQIIGYIDDLGRNLEKYSDLTSAFGEERCRDYFLPLLNTVSKNHTATGETFNKKGKTDILVQDESGGNVFIGECKIWRGAAQFKDAIDQLLNGYVNWRDEKVALMIFNKDALDFSKVIEKSKAEMKKHPNFKSHSGDRNKTSFSYIFQHPEDTEKTIKIELMLFNFK